MAGGYFLSGKFDVRTRADSIIFSALDSFYSDIIKQGEEDVKQEMRTRILNSVGSGCRVVMKSIPSLKTFLEGYYDENADSTYCPTAEQRWKYLLCKLVAATSSRAHPLAIFFDDLQCKFLYDFGAISALPVSQNFTFFSPSLPLLIRSRG